jgi:hypothetical protein
MFYEIKPGSKIKLSEVIAYAHYPEAESEWMRNTLYVTLRGAKESYSYNFGSSYACGRAYEKLDVALAALDTSSNVRMIMD